MAYVSNMQDDEEQKNPAQGAVPPSGGAGVQLAPSSGVGSTGGGPTPGAPTSGGQFASLNQYVNANQGQAQPLADKITSGIGQQYNNLDAQNSATISGINNQVTNAPGYTASNPNTLANEAANPVSFAGDQGNVKQFQSLLNNSYGGPLTAEGTSDFTNQQNAINNAISTGQNATGTEAGREQLLSQNEAAPSTSVTGLNSAILSQSPTALNQVESAYKPFSNLLTNLQTGAQGIDTTIGKEQTDATTSNAAANKQIADQINALNTNVNTELTNATSARDAYNNAVAANQSTWNPVNTQINSINEMLAMITKGFTPIAGGANTVANPLGQYVNAPISTAAPTLQTVATPQDYANAQAFQSLMGNLNTGVAAPNLNPATASQAGTYTAPAAPTIADPKAEARSILDAMDKTVSVNQGPNTGPNGTSLLVANPWFNTGNYYTDQANWAQADPQYTNLTNLLTKIYGGNMGVGY